MVSLPIGLSCKNNPDASEEPESKRYEMKNPPASGMLGGLQIRE